MSLLEDFANILDISRAYHQKNIYYRPLRHVKRNSFILLIEDSQIYRTKPYPKIRPRLIDFLSTSKLI